MKQQFVPSLLRNSESKQSNLSIGALLEDCNKSTKNKGTTNIWGININTWQNNLLCVFMRCDLINKQFSLNAMVWGQIAGLKLAKTGISPQAKVFSLVLQSLTNNDHTKPVNKNW